MNIAVAQSGGPSCAINASLVGVIRGGIEEKGIEHVLGAKNGIDGVLNERYCDLTELFQNDEKSLELLKLTPSTALGSCRIKLKPWNADDSQYKIIFDSLGKRNIGIFFYIGGNDSMDTVKKLSEYGKQISSPIRFVGIPKTIDNDIPGNDHTPGFGSAAKFVCTTVKEIACDSGVYNLPSVTIIEIMGRDAGWLTASTMLLCKDKPNAPQLIYLPEKPFSFERFSEDVRAAQKEHKAVIVAVSEGLRLQDGGYAAEGDMSGKADVFGHKYLAGLGKTLERYISQDLGCKVRSVELNVCQRAASHIASKTDLDEAESVARAGVSCGVNGGNGVIMTIKRISDEPYEVRYLPEDVAVAANNEKKFPMEWINERGNGILPEAEKYFRPLIVGEVNTVFEGGIPLHYTIPEELYNK